MNRFLYIVFILSASLTLAQQDSTNSSEVIEDILETDESEQEDNNLYESLEQLTENPININTADLFELQRIPYIDNYNANLILDYRKKYGYFFSLNELKLIKGLSVDIIKIILPFVTVKDELKQFDVSVPKEYYTANIKLNLRSRMQTDLQQERGYTEGIYIGSPFKSYTRIQGRGYDRFRFGLLIEKDAGERKLNDFSSFFVSAKNILFIDEIIGGDFLVEFGQGLALWSPYGFSKSSDAVLPVKKNADGIKAYTSSDENQFFRGAAAKISYNNYNLTSFFSSHKIDARVDSLSSLILSLPVDGYHRTTNEIGRKAGSTETNSGIIINKSFSKFLRLGLLY
ncbi:MAG: helix-hairpin-helix domain-containing protein, partial [Ignavibacteriaceae bacterium]|nr:helix-hairpin-helix domain-containing protein [Ignavibacteriaceae bacterium]